MEVLQQLLQKKTTNGPQSARKDLLAAAKHQESGVDIVFRDLDVSIGKTSILKYVSGLARAGDMLAVMGPSGAGKSTLLNTISGRKPFDSGTITVNGDPLNKGIRRKICYIMQQDVFFSNLTLRETLTFTALLRLPDTMPMKLRLQRVEEIVDILDLGKCIDTVMGGPSQPGLSGGEKKRANIACELLTNPTIMLLDEPTSGLDSAIAYSLMRTLKAYTEKSGKTVITSIHQPSSQMFYMFDSLLLLANGRVAYFGPSRNVVDFFSKIGMEPSLHYNPADFILEKVKESEEVLDCILTAADAARLMPDWPEELRPSQGSTSAVEVKVIENGIDPTEGNIKVVVINSNDKKCSSSDADEGAEPCVATSKDGDEDMTAVEHYFDSRKKFQTSFWTQFTTLTRRNFLQSRGRILSKLNIIQTLVLSIYCGVIWFQLPSVESTLKDRLGFIFFGVVYFGFVPMFDAITSFPEERGVINKERSSGAYRLSAYYVSKMVSESPLTFALPTMYCGLAYWLAGLHNNAATFLAYLCLMLLSSLTSQAMGVFFGVTISDLSVAVSVGTTVYMMMFLSGGYYQSNFPAWLEWTRYFSFIHYSFQAITKVVLTRAPPTLCNSMNTTSYPDCQISSNGTLLYLSGPTVLAANGFTYPLWIDVMALCVFGTIFRSLGYIVLRYYRRPP